MPGRNIEVHEGEFYHVYNRGALKETLFIELRMYDLFLNYLQRFAKECCISVVVVCLMPNHFHLLVRVEKGGNLSSFMQRLCWCYSRRINSILHRTGTIFQGRYQLKHVPSTSYFKQLCGYLHLNPVKGSLVDSPLDWPFSNYLECVGLRRRIVGRQDLLLEVFGGEEAYRTYVADVMTNRRVKNRQLIADLASIDN